MYMFTVILRSPPTPLDLSCRRCLATSQVVFSLTNARMVVAAPSQTRSPPPPLHNCGCRTQGHKRGIVVT